MIRNFFNVAYTLLLHDFQTIYLEETSFLKKKKTFCRKLEFNLFCFGWERAKHKYGNRFFWRENVCLLNRYLNTYRNYIYILKFFLIRFSKYFNTYNSGDDSIVLLKQYIHNLLSGWVVGWLDVVVIIIYYD